jgi:hypothetical protein
LRKEIEQLKKFVLLSLYRQTVIDDVVVSMCRESYPDQLRKLSGSGFVANADYIEAKNVIYQQLLAVAKNDVTHWINHSDADSRKDQLQNVVDSMTDALPATWVRTVDSLTIPAAVVTVGYIFHHSSLIALDQHAEFKLSVPAPSLTCSLLQNGIETANEATLTKLWVEDPNFMFSDFTGGRVGLTIKTPIADDYVGKLSVITDIFHLKYVKDPTTKYQVALAYDEPPVYADSVTVRYQIKRVIPLKDTLDGSETLGFYLLADKIDGRQYTGPAGFAGELDPRYKHDVIIDHDEIAFSWQGLVPPGGLNKVTMNENNDVESIAVRVSELSAALASQIAAIEGRTSTGQKVSGILAQLGGILTNVGMFGSLISGPLGAAMMGVGGLLTGLSSEISAISSGDPMEIISGVLMIAVGAVTVLHGVYTKYRESIPTATLNKLDAMALDKISTVGDFASKMDGTGPPLASIAPSMSVWIEPLEAGNLPNGIRETVQSVSRNYVAAAAEPGVAQWFSERTKLFPAHAYNVAIMEGEVAATVERGTLVDGFETGAPVSEVNVITRHVAVIEVDPTIGPGGREEIMPGSKGRLSYRSARQWWDTSGGHGKWRWDFSTESVFGNEDFLTEFHANAGDVEAQNRILDNHMRVNSFAVKVHEEGMVIGKSHFEWAAAKYAEVQPRYNLVTDNCIGSAKDLFKLATTGEYPAVFSAGDVAQVEASLLTEEWGDAGHAAGDLDLLLGMISVDQHVQIGQDTKDSLSNYVSL